MDGTGLVRRDGTPPTRWSRLQMSAHTPHVWPQPECHEYLTCRAVLLRNGEEAHVAAWVLTRPGDNPCASIKLARVAEIIQVYGTPAQLDGRASAILVQSAHIVGTAQTYGLPQVALHGWEVIHVLVGGSSQNPWSALLMYI